MNSKQSAVGVLDHDWLLPFSLSTMQSSWAPHYWAVDFTPGAAGEERREDRLLWGNRVLCLWAITSLAYLCNLRNPVIQIHTWTLLKQAVLKGVFNLY